MLHVKSLRDIFVLVITILRRIIKYVSNERGIHEIAKHVAFVGLITDKKLSSHKETVRLLHNVKIRVLRKRYSD